MQGRPPNTDLSNWNIALDKVYNNTSIQQAFRLTKRIHSKFYKSKQNCKWIISTDKQKLYRKQREQQWELWQPVGVGRTRTGMSTFHFSSLVTINEANQFLHTSIQKRTTLEVSLQCTGNFEAGPTGAGSQFKIIQGIPFPADNKALHHVKVPPDQGHFFCKLIQNHTATTCSH